MAKPQKPTPGNVKTALLSSWRGSPHDLERVWSQVLERMLILYYPPFRAEDEVELEYQTAVGLEDYLADLAEFDADTLAAGWQDARRAHAVERWPTIRAIRDACLSRRGGGRNPAQSGGGSGASTYSGGPSDFVWGVRMAGWVQHCTWVGSWGPKPTERHTQVPPHLLERHGITPGSDADAEATRHHRNWMHPRIGQGEAVAVAIQNGRAASALIRSVGAAPAPSTGVPLFPDETMSAAEKERARAASLRRAGERA